MLDLSGLKGFDKDGYIGYYIPNHHLANKAGIVYEHMIVAEEILGRELRDGETVHHKDRNRSNNSFDNLMVFKTMSDHSAFHQGMDIELDGDVYIAIRKPKKDLCPVCGEIKYSIAGVCRNCHNKEKAKNIPVKEELCNLIFQYNMTQIGRMFNVSDNAVRKWCKKYNLPYKTSDIRQLKKELKVN